MPPWRVPRLDEAGLGFGSVHEQEIHVSRATEFQRFAAPGDDRAHPESGVVFVEAGDQVFEQTRIVGGRRGAEHEGVRVGPARPGAQSAAEGQEDGEGGSPRASVTAG